MLGIGTLKRGKKIMSDTDVNNKSIRASTTDKTFISIAIPPSLQDINSSKQVKREFNKMSQELEENKKQLNNNKVFDSLLFSWEVNEKNNEFKINSKTAKNIVSVESILEQERLKAKKYLNSWIDKNPNEILQEEFDRQQLERRFLRKVKEKRESYMKSLI